MTTKHKMNILIFGASSDIGKSIIDNVDSKHHIYGTKNKGSINRNLTKEICCDITKLEDINEVYESVPGLDVIIFSSMPEFLEPLTDFEEYKKSEKFLRGHVYALQEGLKRVSKNGKIIIMSGQSSDYGLPIAPYMGANFSYLSNLAKTYNSKSDGPVIHEFQLGPIDTKIWDRVSEKHQKDFGGQGIFIKPETVANYVNLILNQEVVPTKLILDNFYSLRK